MALNYFIDLRQRLVIVTAEGEITRHDAETYIEAMVGANALDYRKLFDWRAVGGPRHGSRRADVYRCAGAELS